MLIDTDTDMGTHKDADKDKDEGTVRLSEKGADQWGN